MMKSHTLLGDKKFLIVVLFFFILSIWWAWLNFFDPSVTSNKLQLWAALYQVVALYGAIVGFYISHLWGGHRSIMGKAVLAFSIGLLLQSFGQSVYSYYIFYEQIEIPYPSVGDIGFFGSIPMYIYGITMIAMAAGAKFSMKRYLSSKLQLLILPIGMLIFSYSIFLSDYNFSGVSFTKVFLDFGYPLGQAFYVSLAILAFSLTRHFLGGIMHGPVLFLIFALIAQYLSDFTFLYQAAHGIWSAGGFNDFMYLTSYSLMATALIYIGDTFHNLKHA